LSCGEASGERYAVALAVALRRRRPDLRLVGIGSESLRAAGVELWASSDELAMMGFTEVLRHLPRLWSLRREIVRRATADGVDLFLPIDFPGFHVSLARKLRERGVRVLDFIPPKTWSWGSWRLRSLRASVDRCAVIFPFEEAHYRSAGIDAHFVGHPLLESVGETSVERQPSLLLVPGSRRQELRLLAPVMGAVAAQYAARHGGMVRVSRAPGVHLEWLRPILNACPQVEIETGPLTPALRRAGLALVTSGTATLEAALSGTPHLILYRTSPLSYWLARRLARVEHIGMANIVLGRRAYPEFLQGQCTQPNVATALDALCRDPKARARQAEASRELSGRLGGPGAIERVSDLALAMLDGYTGEPSPARR
jgi:lipid-A-disaccharide synthase